MESPTTNPYDIFCSWRQLYTAWEFRKNPYFQTMIAVLLCMKPQTNSKRTGIPWRMKNTHRTSPLSGRIHTTPEKFGNGDLFLRLGLPSTLIRHENGVIGKRTWNRRNLKTPAFRFRVDRKYFEKGPFRKQWRHENHDVIFSPCFYPNTNPKWPVNV